MSISNTDRVAGPYAGNGVAVAFPFGFKVFRTSEVLVAFLNAAGVEVVQVLNSDYTVTLNADQDVEPGGVVTFAVAPEADASITLTSQVEALQPVRLTNLGGFFPEVINTALDRLTILIQQCLGLFSRALALPASETGGNASIPGVAERAGKFLAFDALGRPTVALPVDDSAADVRLDLAAPGGAELVGANDGAGGSLWTTVAGFISRLVSSAGASVVGFVQAGVGAVVRTLQYKLRLVLNVEDFGADGTLAGDSAAIKAAIVAAAGRPIILQPRRYLWDESTITAASVRFWGSGMPTVNAGRTALEGVATIIQGTLNFSGLSVDLRDLGVDRGSAAFGSGGDAVKISAATYNAGRLALLRNVVALGRSATDAFHSILVEGYEHASLENCTGAANMFCGAIKSRNVLVNGFRAINGQNLLILKSDGSGAGSGSLANVNVTNVTGEGSASTAYGVRVLSANVSIINLNISNVNVTGVDELLLVEAGAGTAIYNVNVNNINGHDIRTFGLKTGGAGSLYNLSFSNINLTDLGSRAAQFMGGGQYLVRDAYCSMKAGSTAQAADFFRVEAGIGHFRGEGITLVENFGAGATVPTLLLGSGRSITTLSNIRGRISGTLPLYGFSSQDATGATTTLTPLIDLDRMRSFMKLTTTANCTIVNITSTLPSGTALPDGYEVTLLMTSGFNFVIQHNTNVRTRSQANVTLVNNSTISFVWGGSSWHQKDNTA